MYLTHVRKVRKELSYHQIHYGVTAEETAVTYRDNITRGLAPVLVLSRRFENAIMRTCHGASYRRDRGPNTGSWIPAQNTFHFPDGVNATELLSL